MCIILTILCSSVDSESFERIICLELIGKLSTRNVTYELLSSSILHAYFATYAFRSENASLNEFLLQDLSSRD
jgi:hypothetical protein